MEAAGDLKGISRRKATRGCGLLENFLACERAKKADSLIPASHRAGRIVDMGSGFTPFFLISTKFKEKFGIDKAHSVKPEFTQQINLINYDIESGKKLPFLDKFADIVTMLAVLEHIEEKKLPGLLSEIHRVLKPGGLCIMTVPSTWSHMVLKFFSWLSLVSKTELFEHKTNLDSLRITELLVDAGFERVESGYFEFILNRWFVARRQF